MASVEHHLTGSLVAIGLVAAWPAVCFLAFLPVGWHLEVVAPTAAGVLALVASLRYQVGSVDARARLIRRTFERFVSQAVVEEMLRHPERVRLGGERREMTVLFCDIRGFTSISERLDSEELTELLNQFFTPMTRLVLEAGGTLDKYMGDALMAFFGAPLAQPDHAARACRAALAMEGELRRLNEQWRAEGRLPRRGVAGHRHRPQLRADVGRQHGLRAGLRLHGDRRQREPGLAGRGPEQALRHRDPGHRRDGGGGGRRRFLVRELDRVRVKGKSEAVAIFELLAERPAPAEEEERARAYAAALALYRGRRFAEAEAAFRALDGACPGGDPPAAALAGRCHRLDSHGVAADWEPVETLTSK